MKNQFWRLAIGAGWVVAGAAGWGKDGHDYRHELYDSLHGSAMQDKFRRLAPVPIGVVFLPWAGMTEGELREQFRTMRRVGFHNLKQVMGSPEWPERELMRIALEEGVIPFWYGEGGWEDLTPELLARLGLEPGTPPAVARRDPRVRAYQAGVLKRQVEAWKTAPAPAAGVKGYFGQPDAGLRPEDEADFKAWVRSAYGTVEELVTAWNQLDVGIRPGMDVYRSWADFEGDRLANMEFGGEGPRPGREYGFVRDVLRFKADRNIAYIRATRVPDVPGQPQRAGGEMGLFLPFASRGTDMEGIAEAMREVGSFYPSLHFAWHFEEADYETTRCIYMMASLVVDWFKGGWTGIWESTGGPQQFSGGKGWDRAGEESTAGFTVTAGTMTQLQLSYLAGGARGSGIWTWNPREAGWESGEFALLDRNRQVGERARRTGRIAQAAEEWREELWQAHKEPWVGVLVNWDNEAIWAAVAGPGRTHFKHYPVQARIGISRALINGNIPWEHVTPADLRAGLGPRYRVIYLPAQVAVNADLWPLFEAYVRAGGRLVADAPAAMWNERGKMLRTGPGTPFERIFGASIRDYQYASNVPRWREGTGPEAGEKELEGFILEVEATTATVRERFQTGEPAVTEHRLGEGTAVLLAADASFALRRPGREALEAWTRKWTLGKAVAPFTCEGAIVYRLAAPEADHYFLLNDGEETTAGWRSEVYRYVEWRDALTGAVVDPAAVAVEGYGGRWLRAVKAGK